ncbi:MAG: hypothetical protein K0R53_497 [Burkholderiales bacterium]|jgi:hypothetical protein|nr:hypothetical protein [Burkholderiales bacterium]
MTDAPAPAAIMAIEGSPLAMAMRHELWLYPSVEIIHITGFVILVGSIAMFDVRLLGLSRGLPVREMARHLLPWTLGALLLIVPSGLLMFIAHASDFLGNRAFQIKLLLILTAGINAAIFHAGVYRSVTQWDTRLVSPPAARIHATVSLGLWLGVIACGRLLAYL